MHSATAALARAVRTAGASGEKVRRLSGSYAGMECLVVSCGPSLDSIDPADLQRVMQGRVVIAIKQAIDVTKGREDFLVFNAYNVRRFRRYGPDTIRVFYRDLSGRMVQWNAFDLELPVESDRSYVDDSVASSGRFAEFELSKHLGRPYGPGIMYETVFFLAVHLGVSRIVTIGWDIADPSGWNTHFGDPDPAYERHATNYDALPASPTVTPSRSVPVELGRSALRKVRSASRHWRGAVYNRAYMRADEPMKVRAALPALARWLESHDVDLTVVSDSEWFDSSVRRCPPSELHHILP